LCLNQRQVAVRDRRRASSAPGARVLHSLAPPQPDGGSWQPRLFTTDESASIDSVSEVLIPQTDTPWARAASVCQYIDWVVSRTAEEDPADPLPRVMRDGLVWLDLHNRTLFDGQFVDTGSA